METLFWLLLVASLYSYLIYPLILLLIPVRYQQKKDGEDPEVLGPTSMVIAVHNEAVQIRNKLDNCLQIDMWRPSRR